MTPEQAQQAFEQVGFDTIRQSVLGPVAAVSQLTPETIDTMIAYVEGIITKLTVDPSPEARDQLDAARDELAVFKTVRDFRRKLGKLEERRQARARITVPAGSALL